MQINNYFISTNYIVLAVYIIIPIAISTAMPIALAIVQKKAKNKEKRLNKNEFVMKASKSFGIAMILFAVIWVMVCVIFAVLENNLWVNIILWICEIFLIIICIQSFRQKLAVKKSELEYTPIFGKSRKTAIENIDFVTVQRTGGLLKYKIYVQNKRFCSFANTAVGATLLLEILKNNQIKIIEN